MSSLTPDESAYEAALSSLEPGWIVGDGRYTLVRLLGQGGMGIVWLAEDEQLRERVALKFLPPEVGRDAEAVNDLKRETARARKLAHPNIVRIHDLFKGEHEAFISMEFVEGLNLGDFRHNQPNGVLAWNYLQPVARQLCEALDYAHSEGVIHRDIKPANLMLDSKGRLKLADFGLSAQVTGPREWVLRHAHSGTLTYMSPQQMDGEPPKVTDDIYSLGATLYELLTGQPPFLDGDIPHQIRNRFAPLPTDRLAELGVQNEIPPGVSALVMSCLAKDPEQRPASAKAVAEWLDVPQQRVAAGLPVNPRGPSNSKKRTVRIVLPKTPPVKPQLEAKPPPPAPDAGSKQLLWVGLAGAAVLILLAGVGLGWALLRPNQNLEADLVQETDEMEAVEIREMEKTVINPAPVPSGTSQTAPRLWKLEAHFGEVSGVAFSRDGRFLVSASLDDTIRVSEPETGSLVWTRNAGQRGVRSISISTDSRFLATGGLDSAVRVRVLEDGAPARILPGHLAAVSQVEFGPGEEYLASADDLGGVILWDFQSGEVRSRWRAHSAQIRTMSFSPDGQWLATAGKERQIRLWAIPSGRPGPVLAAHGDVVHDIAFSPDGDWLASTSHDRSLRIWKTSNWSLERTVQYVSRVNRMTPVAFSHDSRFIATGKPSAVVSVFDVRTASIGRGRNLGPRVEDEGDIVSVAFAADGSAVAAGDSNGWIRVWPFRWEN